MADAVVVQDTRIDPEQFLLKGVDTTRGPGFSTTQVAQTFFARSSHWLLLCEREHKNVLDGEPGCPHYEISRRMMRARRGVEAREVDSIESWVEDGVCTNCQGRRVGMRRTEAGSRVYYLSDIEELTHAYAQAGRINGAQAYNALSVVAGVARIHGYIS